MHMVLHWKVTLEGEKGKELGQEGGGRKRSKDYEKKWVHPDANKVKEERMDASHHLTTDLV
eukprot:15048466-Ditylum_brightwellii.AAC.1